MASVPDFNYEILELPPQVSSMASVSYAFNYRLRLFLPENNQEILIRRAMTESTSEFERSNYGMVAAKESSVKEMLKRVKVEDGDKDCVICLEELKIGFDASRMPCSHTFHGNCIEKWLKQSHYCPICRFEMPTD